MADKALLIGVNNYKHVQPLRGCENDLENIRSLLLTTFHFSEKQLHCLRSTDVTKANVEAELTWLFADGAEGDRLLLHFSGHGSYTIGFDDESDQRDELICLYDMDPDFEDDETFLTDNELWRWTQKKHQSAQLVVILDNCHSGTGTRLIDVPTSARALGKVTDKMLVIPQDMKHRAPHIKSTSTRALQSAAEHDEQDIVLARFLTPPPDIYSRGQDLSSQRAQRLKRLNHVLLAACRDDQVAADAFIDNHYQGAFTHHLCQILRAEGGTYSCQQLATRLKAELHNARFSQVPQIEIESEELDRPLFVSNSSKLTEWQSDAPDQDPEIKPAEYHSDTISESTEMQIQETLEKIEETLTLKQSIVQLQQLVTTMHEEIALLKEVIRQQVTIQQRRLADTQALVYIHGIGVTDEQYAKPWFEALQSYAPDIEAANMHAVFWGNLVNRSAIRQTEEEKREFAHFQELLETTIRERQLREMAPQLGDLPQSHQARDWIDDIQNFFGLPLVDDFIRYMTSDSISQQILDRFTALVRPLLEKGKQVELISHSWGSVVAYEGLRELSSHKLPGRVRHFFTVGSPLSMSIVRSTLRRECRDGKKPALVQQWINLNAQGDLVGGSLAANRLAVDLEFLQLEPTNCKRGWFNQYPLVCAHLSYFDPENRKVNQSIFAAQIASNTGS